jgi:hypothetical protein
MTQAASRTSYQKLTLLKKWIFAVSFGVKKFPRLGKPEPHPISNVHYTPISVLGQEIFQPYSQMIGWRHSFAPVAAGHRSRAVQRTE